MHQTAARFEDVTGKTGIDFTYRNGQESGHFSILESLGGGVALFDYDLDGDVDLFATGGGQFAPGNEIQGLKPGLFRNDGRWQFADVVADSRCDVARYYSHGVAAADYDEDGACDLLVTGYGGLHLFHNQGDGTFEEVAGAAGLSDNLWSSSAAWGDLNGDAILDIYVAHYVDWSFENHPYCAAAVPNQREVCPPKSFHPLPDLLYVGNGDGTFRDASSDFGLRSDGKGLGVLTGDVDSDGDLDIYVANDTEPNFLYLNDGAGRFKELGMLSGTAVSDMGVAEGSMGVELADYNLDGRLDLWVTNYERESIGLYRNDGNASFQYVSQMSGVTAVGGLYVGWGTVFFDFDHDGDEDTFVANGHVERYPENTPVRQTPLLLENLKGDWFENVSPAAGDYLRRAHMGRGVAVGDIDGDGDLDLAISHINEPLTLLCNATSVDHHSISLRLIGRQSNRSAIGALIRIRTAGGEQMRHVKGGTSYASTSDARVHVGLGPHAVVESVEVRWPSGTIQTLADVPADRQLTVIEGTERVGFDEVGTTYDQSARRR